MKTSRVSVRVDNPCKRQELCDEISNCAAKLKEDIFERTYETASKNTSSLEQQAVVRLHQKLKKLQEVGSFRQEALNPLVC